MIVLNWIILSSEHVKHSLGDHETTGDVDGRNKYRGGSQCLWNRMRSHTSTHQQETTDSRNTRDGVRDRHEWGMECWLYTPNTLVTSNDCKGEGGKHGVECWVGWAKNSESYDGSQ